LGDKKYAIYNSGNALTNNISENGSIFDLLGYVPEGPLVKPEPGEKCEVLSRAVSPVSGNVFVRIKFEKGECVIREDRLQSDDASKEVWEKNRQTIRTGRGIRALLSSSKQQFTDAEIEDFVNKYKSAFDRMNDIFSNFELVSGNDIAYWYNYKNYLMGTDRGSLGNSCMAEVNASYFDIYTENPNVCSLLILKAEENPDKIKGRALVWKLSSPEITFMDRIYTQEESDVQLFRDYAKSKGWSHKIRNDSSPDSNVIGPDGSKVEYNKLRVNIIKGDYSSYPYVDTLKYYHQWTGLLTTEGGGICLEDTGGGYVDEDCQNCGGSGEVECPECWGSGKEECGECGGSGKIECSDCDGCGEVDCDECSGSGRKSCETCDGEGEVDGETCEDCDGGGEVDCDECNGKGKRECGECYGEGENECDNCDGKGEVDCEFCYGRGEVDCPDCT